jgi:predicted nicotinamide N-methyase
MYGNLKFLKMNSSNDNQKLLQTTIGDFPLEECRLRLPNREISILHVAAMLTHTDESHFLLEEKNPLPYGIALWASTIALGQDIISRANSFRDKRVLELGAGTGLPGIIAASLAAKKVVQTDKNNLALTLCKRNCELNGIETIEHRLDDWTNWLDGEKYDWIIGSDILYSVDMHPPLMRIFESNLSQSGRILISDPFRKGSMPLFELMEANGWSINISKWSIGDDKMPRYIGIFELSK